MPDCITWRLVSRWPKRSLELSKEMRRNLEEAFTRLELACKAITSRLCFIGDKDGKAFFTTFNPVERLM